MMSESDEKTVMLGDQLIMLEALYDIALSSSEAEIVRIAVQALTNSQAGLAYLNTHPITL